ncbi:MAG: heavy-metal-associated domain-containing protein [Clostridia bacterium]|nr:heavy-metal-associated domain-containing protein [Clostridia bacterium]
MKSKFSIKGLDCPNCAAKLESMFAKLDGVDSAKINFLTEKITIESDLDAEELLSALRKTALAFSKRLTVEAL